MSAPDLTAAQVMNLSAALLNDPNRTKYTYTVQIPYLRMAMQELQEHFEQNGIPSTKKVSTVIQVNANVTAITYNAAGTPTNPRLPDDMVEPAQLWERSRGIDPYIPMTKRDYLPHSLEGIQIGQFLYYTWNDQKIEFLPANANNDIKIDYIKELFSNINSIDENTQINIINAATFLEYRTAALVAEFIERNKSSADGLNVYAVFGSDRVTSIGVKGKQNIFTRRKPFRAGYKRRGWVT